ncbi:MAG: zinc-dependent metalloprotease [Acidobacteriota bacterium]|nr:MAG: zinc-dependent metalloprotease [Acidobacteriota bacterium]
MSTRASRFAWSVAALAASFVLGMQGEARAVDQAVVTPSHPVFGAQVPESPVPELPRAPEVPLPDAPAPEAPAPEGPAPQAPGPDDGPIPGRSEPPAPQPRAPEPGEAESGRVEAPEPRLEASRPVTRSRGSRRSYEELLADAQSDDGMFLVHRVGDTVYFEIPADLLDRDILWVTRLKRTTLGAGYGGEPIADRVVRWSQRGDRVFLQLINYDVTADPSEPIARAVADANVPTILRSFGVIATSPAGNPVIDVTGLLLSEIAEFSPRDVLNARGMDQSRSYLEKVVSYPENVNVQVTQTYTGGGSSTRGMRGTSGTVTLYHSLVRLPDEPMKPRLYDSRVGYFTTSTLDYSRDENRAVQRRFITRYRLEKKDPTAPVSDPVKPIVYYVDPATPPKLVPYIKKGIEDWQAAFEAAGFSNAILAKDPPSPEEDPDWDPEDVRYSVVRWLPSTIENAQGPHVADPRSGEILEADVLMYHNIQHLATMWYVSQVGALDPRVTKLPLPDELIGELVRFIVAHEIGHTLGLRHNMRASSLYTVEQVRNPEWVREHGHTPSIMDYARFNYVAQPEDGIAVEDLVPKIGPYDKWAIRWGYAPIPEADTPDAERPVLDAWAREQDTTPYLRFMTSGESESAAYPFDPGQQREAVGDHDPVRATRLGLRNLERVASRLVEIAERPGEPWDDLEELYKRVVAQWRIELGHVSAVVGGIESRELYAGQPGLRFEPVPRARQAAAVAFLLEHGFQVPSFLTTPDLLRRFEPTGVVNRIRVAQTSLMNALLQPARLDRMVEQSVMDPGSYTVLNLLTDLRRGIWKELDTPGQAIDLYRRNVQRAYLDTIDARLNGSTPLNAEVRALLRGELRELDAQIARVLPDVQDVASRRHLEDARETIATILDPRVLRAGQLAGSGARRAFVDDEGAQPAPRAAAQLGPDAYDFEHDPFIEPGASCWYDPRID